MFGICIDFLADKCIIKIRTCSEFILQWQPVRNPGKGDIYELPDRTNDAASQSRYGNC